MMKKLFKFIGILLLIGVVIGFIAFYIADKPLPEGEKGAKAEQLADEMLNALNKAAFDTLEYIEFTFKGVHRHKWDRLNNSVTVEWDDQSVYVDLNKGQDSYSLLEYKAYEYFINDSFWLVAPFKIKDEGTVRLFVDQFNNRGLLVTYTSGGVTPGDSYLWIIDSKGYPIAWKLWTSNVPIGGLKFTWDGWVTMDEVWFSTLHESAILDLSIGDLKVR